MLTDALSVPSAASLPACPVSRSGPLALSSISRTYLTTVLAKGHLGQSVTGRTGNSIVPRLFSCWMNDRSA